MSISEAERTSPGWIPDSTSFGARLILVRQRMGWGNVKEAAVECGLPPESWRTWERDGVTPRRIVEVSTIIATRTGCNFLWLLTGSPTGQKATHGYRATSRLLAKIDPSRPKTPRNNPRPKPAPTEKRPKLLRRTAA